MFNMKARTFKKVYSWKTRFQRLIDDSKKRVVHKDISMIVDGDSKTLTLNIKYKKQ